MTEEMAAAVLNARAAALNCSVAGMVAANMQQQAKGFPVHYGDADFAAELARSGCTPDDVAELIANSGTPFSMRKMTR